MKARAKAAPTDLADLAAELAAFAQRVRLAVDPIGAVDQDCRAVSDSRIAIEPSDASPPTTENTMCRIHGPYPDRKGWRIKVVERATGKATSHTYATESEAREEAARLRRKAARELGVSVETALAEYERYLVAKGSKDRSVKSTFQRLRAVFRGQERRPVALTREEAEGVWSGYVARPTRFKVPPATDTQMNVLHETRTFTRWCEMKKWSKVADPFSGIQVIGSRRRGKEQLDRVDDARRWLGAALELAAAGDKGALAAAAALLMGMRASEIADRLVRDVDDEGRVLIIPHAKTRAGIRRLRIPEALRPLFADLSRGKAPTDRLFGAEANRFWLRLAVRRICRVAKTPVVGPHGLRGTHATLAVEAGVTGDVVAAALGHESFAVTANHYAKAESVAAARTRRVESALDCGIPREFRKSSAGDQDAA